MNDRSAQRLAMLQEALASGGTLHLRDAAELCGVSEMTIRRDLATQPSPLSLLGGRLVMASYPGVTPVYDLTEQQASHYHVKHRLCQRAASFIDEGDTLFIDCGSTLIPLLGQLSHFRELTVVTYALNVANTVAALPNVRLVLLGGAVSRLVAVFRQRWHAGCHRTAGHQQGADFSGRSRLGARSELFSLPRSGSQTSGDCYRHAAVAGGRCQQVRRRTARLFCLAGRFRRGDH